MLLKIGIASSVIVILLIIFKITKKYKYVNQPPIHLKSLTPPYKPMFAHHPMTLNTMANFQRYIEPRTSKDKFSLISYNIETVKPRRSTGRPRIKWITKQEPLLTH